MKHAIVGPAAKHEAAGSGQHRPPIRRVRVRVCPHSLASVDIPRLHFTDMVGARGSGHGACRAREWAAGRILHPLPRECGAQILVRGDVDHPGLRAESHWRPILATPKRRAEICLLVGARLVVGINLRPPGLRIHALENVLLHKWPAIDKIYRTLGALEEPEIAVASHVDQTTDRSSIPLVVDQNRRRYLIPIPRFVRIVLMVALDPARGHIDRDCRGGEEIVAWALVTHPRAAVAHSPERQVRFWVVVPG